MMAIIAILVMLNGKPVEFKDAKPFIENQSVMVPLRGVFEAMGASVDYSAPTGDVFVRGNRKFVEVAVGETQGYVNGVARPLGAPVQQKAGRVFVTLSFIAEALGANVRWNSASHTAFIETATGASMSSDGQSIAAGKIELRATSDKKYYKSGEPVRFTLTAINQDDRPRVLHFLTGQSFDITITPKAVDKPRWDWSRDRMFTQALRDVSLKPGETMTFNAVWKQQNNEGSEMPRGDFLIQAKLTSDQAVVATPFTIRLVN
jgi:hypothetical protein